MGATFTVSVQDGAIVLEDQNKGRSVTNDAENVIRRLAADGYDLTMPVIYRDTMGQYDQLVVKAGKFFGFRTLGGANTYAEARVALAEPDPKRRRRVIDALRDGTLVEPGTGEAD